MEASSRPRAVVIGASLAGLLAAQALHESFAEVVVIDRDMLPDGPQPRRGVPQSHQVHGLLARGRQELDELFDGFSAEVVGLGAPSIDVQDKMQWWVDGKPLAHGRSDMIGLAVSRPLLESVIRRRVAGLPNVRIMPGHAVTDLVATAGGDRVTGVEVTRASGRAVLDGVDLVVDASGRGSRATLWLSRLGCPEVEQERIDNQVTYVSRRYRREPQHLGGRLATAVAAYPGNPRGGFVLAQENDTWITSVSGCVGAVPPTVQDGMLAWADELASSDVATIMRTAAPISDPVRMRFPGSSRLRLERLDSFPAGFLVLGDALCSFNPFYAQGMSVAAMQANELRRLLKDGFDDLATRFFTAAAAAIDVPWATVAANDLRFPEAVGDRSRLDPQRGAYLARLRAAAVNDPLLATAFLRVTQLIDSPTALFAPQIADRVPA